MLPDNLLNIFTLFLTFVVVTLSVKYNWCQLVLYYYSLKIPGYFGIPPLGSIKFLKINRKAFFREFLKIIESSPPVFKIWFGPNLYVSSSRPDDVELILKNFLEKASFYQIIDQYAHNSLFTAPVEIWKNHRKIFSPSFNSKVINGSMGIFNRRANAMVESFGKNCGTEVDTLFPKVWANFLNASLEALMGVQPENLEQKFSSKMVETVLRSEELIIERVQKVWLYSDFFWKMSSSGQRAKLLLEKTNISVNMVLDMNLKEKKLHSDDTLRKHRFLDNISDFAKIPRENVIEQMKHFGPAGSETLASALTSILLVLGIEQQVQEKMYQEQVTIFQNEKRPVTLKDVSKMVYLDRVVKETLRILPPAPFILRSATENIHLDSYTFPAGSHIIIPIIQIQRNPDVWPQPLKFDPDRFLPEKIKERHRCSFIPFSIGSRNCIGIYYAMLFLKVTVATMVRSLKVTTVNCADVKDIQIDSHMVAKAENYHRVIFERR